MHGKVLQAQPFEDAIATLGTVATMVQLLPSWAAASYFASQANGAIGVGTAHSGGIAVLVVCLEIVAFGYDTLWVIATRFGTAPLG